jgi:hypothetical protein
LASTNTRAAALTLDQVGDLQVLDLERVGGVHHQDHHLGEGDRADGVVGGELLQLFLHLGLASQAGGVDQADGASSQLQSTGMASRVIPASGRPAAALADQGVDQGDLPRSGGRRWRC